MENKNKFDHFARCYGLNIAPITQSPNYDPVVDCDASDQVYVDVSHLTLPSQTSDHKCKEHGTIETIAYDPANDSLWATCTCGNTCQLLGSELMSI